MNLKKAGKIIFMLILILFISCIFAKSAFYDKTEEKINIDFIYSLEGNLKVKHIIIDFVKKFELVSPNYIVDIHFANTNTEVIMKYNTLKNSNNKTIVASLNDTNIFNLMYTNAIVPLDNYILESKGINYLQETSPYAMVNSVYNGYIWSLPNARNSAVVYYDKDKVSKNFQENERVTLSYLVDTAFNGWKLPFTMYFKDILTQYICYNENVSHLKQSKLPGTYLELEQDSLTQLQILSKLDIQSSVAINGDSEERAVNLFLDKKTPVLISSFTWFDYIFDNADFEVSAKPLYINNDSLFPTKNQNFYIFKTTNEGERNGWALIDWFTSKGIENEFAKSINSVNIKSKNSVYYENALKNSIAEYEYNVVDKLAVYEYPKVKIILEDIVYSILFKNGESLNALEKQIQTILQPYGSGTNG